MKAWGIFLPILIWIGFADRCEATIYNSNGTPGNIQFIHDSQAQNGDTITIPSGTFTWATGVTITKVITLQGAGTSATGGGDQTVIIDNYASGQPLLNFQAGSTI